MSFITRCPACSTSFRVVPDQLKLAKGWVRCGHCNEVFEAVLHRQAEQTLPGEDPGIVPQTTSWNEDIYLKHKPIDPMLALGDAPVTAPVGAPLAPLGVSGADDAHRVPLTPPDEDPWQMPPMSTPVPSPSLAVSPDDTPIQELGFVRSARRDTWWDAMWVQGTAMVAAGVLAATAALQLTSFALGHAQVPVITPLVRGWCQVVACGQIEYRQVEKVLIESTALIRQEPAGRYRYEMSVINQSEHNMVPPALELTLIDANDAVLVKKVLTGAQWMPTTGPIKPKSHIQAQLGFELSPKDAAEMAGYRAVLFYP